MRTVVAQQKMVTVWDPLVRIFHWSLATFFLVAYVTEDEWLSVHTYAGYAVAGLIGFRLVWGIIGTRYARFRDFVTGPAKVARYLGQVLRGGAPRYLGHNPAGAAMIVILLASLAITAFTGMAIIAGDGSGPLAGTFVAGLPDKAFEEVHEFFANLTLFLVIFHVAGVLVSSRLHRENLMKAMVTGRKPLVDAALDEPSMPATGMEGETP